MTKALTLKPRNLQRGNYTWHDLFIMQQALDSIAKGKPISKIALWLNLAAKMQYQMEELNLAQNLSEDTATDVTIELRNVEARLLWKELRRLKPGDFGRNQMGQPVAPPMGLLAQMLTDVAEQLGYKMPEVDKMPGIDEDEEEGEE